MIGIVALIDIVIVRSLVIMKDLLTQIGVAILNDLVVLSARSNMTDIVTLNGISIFISVVNLHHRRALAPTLMRLGRRC